MANANLVILMGNLTRQPEVRYTPSGRAVGTMTLAVNHPIKDQNTGEWSEKADFIRVSVWGKQAENCEKYLSKGRGVYIEGRISQNKWEDQSGETRSRLEVVAQKVQFLPSGNRQKDNTAPGSSNDEYNEDNVEIKKLESSGSEEDDEEIPF
ncbi:single-stranded DNA-binding protein [Elusimicrobiota bacterium]